MDKNLKGKKGKSTYEDLPEIPDYERPELEKFEKEEYEYNKENESNKDTSLKEIKDNDDKNDDETSKNKFKKAKASKAEETSPNLPDKNVNKELNKTLEEENTPKNLSDATKKPVKEKSKLSPKDKIPKDGDDEQESTRSSSARKKKLPLTDEPSDEVKLNPIKENADSDATKKIRKKPTKSSYELPEIPDYERPELEKFDKNDHEFTWEGSEQERPQIDDVTKESGALNKSNAPKALEPQKTQISKSEAPNKIDEKSPKDVEKGKIKSITDDSKVDENVLKRSPKKDDEQKPLESSLIQKSPKSINEDLKKIPDGDKAELENYQESDYDPLKKSKIKKLKKPNEDLPEIPDYEPPKLEKFNKDDHDFWNQDVEMKEPNIKTPKAFGSDGVNNSPKEKSYSSHPIENEPQKSKEVPQNDSKETKDTFRKRPEVKQPSKQEEKIKDLKSTPKQTEDLLVDSDAKKRGINTKGKQDDLPKIDDDERPDLEKYKKSDFDPSKAQKEPTILPLKTSDESKTLENDKPQLEKYERSEFSPAKKSKDNDEKSWSGKVKPKENDDENGIKLKPFDENNDGKKGEKLTDKKTPKDAALKDIKKDDESLATRKSSLKDKNDENPRKSSLEIKNESPKDDSPLRKGSIGKEDENSWSRKSSFDKPRDHDSSRKSSMHDDKPIDFNKPESEMTANERYLMRRLRKKSGASDPSITLNAPKQDPPKISSEAESTSADIRKRPTKDPSVIEEAASKNIQIKEPREVPIEIMITEAEDPPKPPEPLPKLITKPGPRSPRYDPLAFVPEDEELPPQTIPTPASPTTPTSPSSPNKARYNPFKYDLDDDETPTEKVNTQIICAT